MKIQTKKGYVFPDNVPCAICNKSNPDKEMSFSFSAGNEKIENNNIPVHLKCERRYDIYKLCGFLIFGIVGYLLVSYFEKSPPFVYIIMGIFAGSIAVTLVNAKLNDLCSKFIKSYATLVDIKHDVVD